eukprot:scaffold8097_cov258-Pinguiococcus_pyrenoidosus.AAC.6
MTSQCCPSSWIPFEPLQTYPRDGHAFETSIAPLSVPAVRDGTIIALEFYACRPLRPRVTDRSSEPASRGTDTNVNKGIDFKHSPPASKLSLCEYYFALSGLPSRRSTSVFRCRFRAELS